MEELLCERTGCNNLIPKTRKAGALFCCEWCGWTHRNRQNKESDKEKRVHSRKVDINYNIVRDLYNKGVDDVSIESLELLGFDFDYCTGVDDLDIQTGIMKFKVFEFLLTPHDHRYKISKPAS